MARAFDGTNQYLTLSSAPVTGGAFSMCAWFYTTVNNARDFIFDSINPPTYNNGYRLDIRGDVAGDYLNFTTLWPGGGSTGVSSVGISTNTWQHACGTWTGTLANVYLDGGNKGTSVNLGPKTISGVNATSIGNNDSGSLYFTGNIAEVGIWNVVLTDAEAAILGKGYSPLLVRPASLIAYWPLIGRTSPEIDIVGGYGMALVNAPTVANHPRIIYPTSQQVGLTISAAPPAGAIMPQFQYANLGASLYNGTLIG